MCKTRRAVIVNKAHHPNAVPYKRQRNISRAILDDPDGLTIIVEPRYKRK